LVAAPHSLGHVLRCTMALRAAVYASLPLGLLGADMAPGCGCQVSHCCEVFNNSPALGLAPLFNESLESSGQTMGNQDHVGDAAVCSFLNLVPGMFDQAKGGVCSESAAGMANTSVCEAIAASTEPRGRLRARRPSMAQPFSVLANFLEPGSCAELQDGACWESRDGNATYSWDGSKQPSWCAVLALVDVTRLKWSMTCAQDGGLDIKAKWLDDDVEDGACPSDGSGNYSGGLEATLRADDWLGGSDGSPSWRCFDVPGGPSDYRILAYSVGTLPCAAETTSTTPASSGSFSTSLAALAYAAIAAVVAEAMA